MLWSSNTTDYLLPKVMDAMELKLRSLSASLHESAEEAAAQEERAAEEAASAAQWELEATTARGQAEAATTERLARSQQVGHIELRCRSLVAQVAHLNLSLEWAGLLGGRGNIGWGGVGFGWGGLGWAARTGLRSSATCARA